MGDAAKNPGGIAGAGVGLGAGYVMAQQVGQAMNANAGAPPPLPQSASFHVAYDGKQTGPYDMAKLEQDVASGRLTRDSLVWRQGMVQWTPAGQVAELKNLFGSLPPPLPPGKSSRLVLKES